jgi:A/G-specific adenine glycosylase
MKKENSNSLQHPLVNMPSLLLSWYDGNKRELPWRENPLPYSVWISEIMLQQTRVEAVKPYFERFFTTFPTVASLAKAEETVLLKVWEGLGYYSRARNLQKAANMIIDEFNGQIPSMYEELLRLPGIGDYTAGAVASIAFQKAVPAVDGNVLRVYTRLVGSMENIGLPDVKKRIRADITEILPKDRPGDFNQALMELGAVVCLPNGAPLCKNCPLSDGCVAREQNLQDKIPVKTPKKERRIEERTVFLLVSNGKVALCHRENKGLLSNMWEFPNTIKGNEQSIWDELGIKQANTEEFGIAKHIFTHVEWHMNGVLFFPKTEHVPAGWEWADRAALTDIYPIPNAFKAYVRRLFKEELI